MSKLNELIEWMERLDKPTITGNAYNSLLAAEMTKDMILAKARELRDAEQKEPPYDREAFRRELIVKLCTDDMFDIRGAFKYADEIIAEYERRQNEQR